MVPLKEPNASYASLVMPISKQLNSKETPKRLLEAQIRQSNTHIWQKKIDNSTTTKELALATQQMKPKVWKWIPKQKQEDTAKKKFTCILKTSTTSQNQSLKKPQQFWQPSITPSLRNVVVHQRWIPKSQVHHIDLYWAWVSKSLLYANLTSMAKHKPNQ